MSRTFKKVLSVVLSLAMIATSITVYNTTTKAGEPIEFTVTATKRADGNGMDASWTKPDGLTQITADNPDGDYATLAYYLNTADQVALDANHYAAASNGYCWTVTNSAEDRVALDTVTHTNDGTLNVSNGGDFVIVVQYLAADGTVVAQGTSGAVTFEEVVNTDLNLRQDRVDEANKVLFLKWDLIAHAAKYEIIDADTNKVLVTKTDGDWEQFAYEEGKTYNYLMKVYDESGGEIQVKNNTFTFFREIPDNFDAALSVVYGTGTATLSWKAITGAASYVVYSGEEELTKTTETSYTMNVEEGVALNITVKAFNAENAEIVITNNTKEVQYVAEGAPAENDITKVDTSSWDKLSVKAGSVDNEYYINTSHTLDKSVWYGIYAPHTAAAYHNRGAACNIPDGTAAFEFKDTNISEIWVNQVKYENGSTAFSMRDDQAEISLDVLTEVQNVITLVYNDGHMNTFAIMVKGEEAPDTSNVDITAWTSIPVKGADAANITNTYSMNTAGYTAYVNAAIYGVYAPATSTDYHAGTCNIQGAALAWAIGSAANARTVWVDGVKYLAGSEYVHVRNDSIEIAESLFAKEGIHYVSIVGGATATFAVKTEAPKDEEAPDQTLEEVTDWVMVGTKENADYTTEDGINSYYVSEAFRNAYINHVDLFGLYTDHTATPYHPAACTVTGAVYVSSYPTFANTIKSVWVDGVKYTSGTAECYIEGDQVHLAQSIFATAKTYAVTVRTADADYTYAVKVDAAPKETTYAITVDGKEVANVVENGTYTLGDAQYGYLCDGKMYAPNTEVKVTGNMTFTSVNELSVTMARGAGIRYLGTAGIRFQATIVSDNMDAVASEAITEGTLITAQDIYEANGQPLELTSDYTKLNVVNSGWYNGTVGTYCGSICDVVESNYIRNFTARAYVTINYENAAALTVYSDMGPVRSISQVATAVKAAGYAGIAEEYHSVIDSFIK